MILPNLFSSYHLELDLTITKIESQTTFAGRLGRRIEQTIHVKTWDGRTVKIRLEPYHTRMGEPKRTYKVGDKF